MVKLVVLPCLLALFQSFIFGEANVANRFAAFNLQYTPWFDYPQYPYPAYQYLGYPGFRSLISQSPSYQTSNQQIQGFNVGPNPRILTPGYQTNVYQSPTYQNKVNQVQVRQSPTLNLNQEYETTGYGPHSGHNTQINQSPQVQKPTIQVTRNSYSGAPLGGYSNYGGYMGDHHRGFPSYLHLGSHAPKRLYNVNVEAPTYQAVAQRSYGWFDPYGPMVTGWPGVSSNQVLMN